MDKPKISQKNIVKEIFERQKSRVEKISTLFTHFKHPPRAEVSSSKPASSSFKPLTAAIDIGASSIKLLQLAEGPKGEVEVIALDRQEYFVPKHQDPEAYQKQALDEIVKRNNIGTNVISGMGAKEVQMLNLNFPMMSEVELKEAIRWKIIQVKPFGLDIEDLKYDFIKWENYLPPAVKPTQQKILLACAPKELIRQKLSLFQQAGLNVTMFTVTPLNLANLYRFKPAKIVKDEVTVWFDLGDQESSFTIGKEGYAYFLKNYSLSSQNITKQISYYSRLNEKEAETAKRNFGLSFWLENNEKSDILEPKKLSGKSKDKPAAVFYAISSLLENLVVDTESTFKYFSYQVSQSQIIKFDRVILCGGGARLKNLEDFLGAKLRIPVEKINPFSVFKPSVSIGSEKRSLLKEPCDFACAAALAAAQFIKKPEVIDLMLEKEKKPAQIFLESLEEKPVKAVMIILALVTVLAGMQMARAGIYKWKMNAAASNVKKTQVRLNRLQSSQLKLAQEESELLNKKLLLKARLDLLEKGVRKPKDFSKVLAQIASLLPEDIWVTNLTYLERKLTITGSSSNTGLIMDLMDSLRGSNYFEDVTFSYSQKEPGAEVYHFEVSVKVKE